MSLPSHLYIHIPFCESKCAYCAFYSERMSSSRSQQVVSAILRELRTEHGEGLLPFRTVYMGGGTPTVLETKTFMALLEGIRKRILEADITEWTVEANPSTLTLDKLSALRAAGVTRLSIGAQSFDDAVLLKAGRSHDAAATRHAFMLARRQGFKNIGLDLIAGLPGVNRRSWERDLDSVLALTPEHVSVYALTIEPPSLWHRTRCKELCDDAMLDRLDTAEHRLGAAGYVRYEISNYAMPGKACRHNLACWRGEDYLGLGPAAASRQGRRRWTNRPSIDAYASTVLNALPPPREQDVLSEADDKTERFIFGLRLAEGVDPTAFAPDLDPLYAAWTHRLDQLADEGLVVNVDTRWRLTSKGRNLADYVMSELL
jgi:oxygen-independent coproporphyrinogen-3 oxidase